MSTTTDTKSTALEQIELADLKSKPNAATYDAFAGEFAFQTPEWHSQETKRLLRKVDWHLLPWIILMYLTNFLGRTYALTRRSAHVTRY